MTASTQLTGNLLIAKVKIRGTRTLLLHHFGPNAIPLERKERTGAPGNNPDEWKDTVLMDSHRQLYILPTYIFGCLREAAVFTKRGRGTLQRSVAATAQVLDETILIHDRYVPENPQYIHEGKLLENMPLVYVSVSGVKNPGTKGRNMRYRVATVVGWECEFCLSWDKTIISRQEMQAILLDGGRQVGLADGRGIGYGKFEIVTFAVDMPDSS